MRSFRVGLVAFALLSLTAACTGGSKPTSSRGSLEVPAEAPAPGESTTTTALTAAAVVLAPDGLGTLPFGTQAARAMDALTQAFGRAEAVTPVPPESDCGATRMFRWKDFTVLINEVTAQSGGSPGLVGWSLGATAPVSTALRTDKGISIGATAAAVKAAYGPATTQAGPTLTITTPTGVITADLDGASDASRVKTLRAGASCRV